MIMQPLLYAFPTAVRRVRRTENSVCREHGKENVLSGMRLFSFEELKVHSVYHRLCSVRLRSTWETPHGFELRL